MNKSHMYNKILNSAEALIQTKGYNAFSYRDIAKHINIKTSSIHYYFPTKTDLGKMVVKKHLDTLTEIFNPLLYDKKLSSYEKLDLFIDTLVDKTYADHQKMCLGGMLASDVLTLPKAIQKEVEQFFNRIISWLKHLLTEGVSTKEFKLQKKHIQAESIFILSLFEGSLLLARLFEDKEYLASAKRQILIRLTS